MVCVVDPGPDRGNKTLDTSTCTGTRTFPEREPNYDIPVVELQKLLQIIPRT